MHCSPPGSSLSMEFSRQEHWSGLLFPSLGDFPDPGIEPRSPALWADFTDWATREWWIPSIRALWETGIGRKGRDSDDWVQPCQLGLVAALLPESSFPEPASSNFPQGISSIQVPSSVLLKFQYFLSFSSPGNDLCFYLGCFCVSLPLSFPPSFIPSFSFCLSLSQHLYSQFESALLKYLVWFLFPWQNLV